MRFMFWLFLLSNGIALSQNRDSILQHINSKVKAIDDMWFHEKLQPDTVLFVNEEYEHFSVVAWYKDKKLQKIRVDNSDGAAGDISSGEEYYFNDGSLVFIRFGSSYFMAGGCGRTEEIYFYKGDFVNANISTDCVGENAESVRQYLGEYTFDLESNIRQYKYIKKTLSLKMKFPVLMAKLFF